MAAIPGFLVGKNVSLAEVSGLSLDSGGNIVDLGDYDLHSLGVFDTMSFRVSGGLEDITATDAGIKNNQQTQIDFDIEISELVVRGGTSSLALVSFTSAYIRVQCSVTNPVNSALQGVFAAIGVIQDFDSGGIQVGKNIHKVTLKPCGVFPFYSPTGGSPSF